MSECEFDLFISCAEADRSWVESFFIPTLGLPENRLITQMDFRPGAKIINEFERAVDCSRYVVIVFSQAYLTDRWAVFGEHLAGFASVAGQNNKLIPLILEECSLPLHAETFVRLDCRSEGQWKAEAARLRTLLGTPEPVSVPIPCPYPGLRPFNKADASRFYGRETEIDELAMRLRRQYFLLVLGPSGSGKSSLVLSGLVHELEKRQPGEWEIHDLRPGPQPYEALVKALGDHVDLETGTLKDPGGPRLLFVIDQLEEMFLQARPEDQERAIRSINQLRRAGSCTLVLVLRADFFGELMNSTLWPIDVAQRFELAVMRGDALRLAVQKPALSVGVVIEGSLVERMVADAEGQAGVLPLMQEALSLLWELRMERLISISAYRRLGEGSSSGLARAISMHADGVYEQLSSGEQAVARHVLVRLVQFNEGRPDTRRQLPQSELRGVSGNQLTRSVILRLAEQRLLSLNGETDGDDVLVDLAHEALIDAWPRLQGWIQEDRIMEQIRRRLLERARDWLALGRRGGLLDPLELDRARECLSSSTVSVLDADKEIWALVAASSQELRARARLRWMVPAAAVTGALLLGLLTWQGWLLFIRMRASQLNHPVLIPAGKLLMGDKNSSKELERETKEFYVPAFSIDEHEVTNQQYCLCRQSGTCTNDPSYSTLNVCDPSPDMGLLPVTRINLEDAYQFCRWLDRRLPSEVEWEWTAKGPEGNPYPTGKTLPSLETININHDGLWRVDRTTTDRLPDSPVFGMAGNAREWTISVSLLYNDINYLDKYWPGNFIENTDYVVIRGGSYLGGPDIATSINRYKSFPQDPAEDLGFRCVSGLPIEKFIEQVKSGK